VTLPPFDLHRPASVEEAGRLFERYGDAAAFYCGGTELLLLLKLGFAAFGHLVDVKRIDELGGIRSENGTIVIGSTVTHREIERSALVLERLPALAAMERRVANIRVRGVGTLGGNLCFSDPHSDPATFLLALDAEVECRRGADARRQLRLSDFVLGPYETALEPGELLASVRVPVPSPGTGAAHRKLAFNERPAATVAVLVRAEGNAVVEARIAVGSVGVRPVRAAAAEQMLAGMPLAGGPELETAAELAAEASEPVEDANGSADYKANLVSVLVRRCFVDAASLAAA
jgi:carbon-monoxide dehydrogenase medium subunit